MSTNLKVIASCLTLAVLTAGTAYSIFGQASAPAAPPSKAQPAAPGLDEPDQPATAPVPATPAPRAPKRSSNRIGGGGGGFAGGDTFGGSAGGFGGTMPAFEGAANASPAGAFPSTLSLSRSNSGRDSVPPVVVEFSSAEPAAMQHMEEDLAVMTHLISQALEGGLGEDTPPSAMGVPLLYTAGGRSVRSMYLGGFGALFMIKVNMPLMAQPAPAEAKPAEKVTDSEWEAARREVLGLNMKEETFRTGTASETPFDPEQVEALKRTLIGALKNAVNIRALKNDEYVSLAVFGQPMAQTTVNVASVAANPAHGATSVTKSTSDEQSNESATPPKASSSRSGKSSRKVTASRSATASSTGSLVLNGDGIVSASTALKGTVLTLRAKKSDINAFAQGKTKLEDFAKTVSVTTYPGNGYGLASVNTWVGSGRVTR